MMNKITAIYCRIARSGADNSFAIAIQRDTLIRFAKEHGFENIECYEDIGFSGSTMADRPAFQKLQSDIDAGRVQRVITRSLDRVGRNTVEAVRWISSLRERNVDFITTLYELPVTEMLEILAIAESEMAHEQ